MFGFLNIYKPAGMTSHDVVSVLRKILKIKQIGHTGTLDPFAQGVLPIAVGKATRLIEYLQDDKEYLAEVKFGISTDTYDKDGNITLKTDKKANKPEIENALKNFEGEIQQIPPIYSAIKVQGKKLYEYARKGENVEIEPRKVFIEKIELNTFNEENQVAEILVKCSKGTYIRSIAHDLGEILQTGAHLTNLVRTQAGAFFAENSIKLENIKDIELAKNALINPLDVLNLQKMILSNEEEKKISFGQRIKNRENYESEKTIILIYNNSIKAIAQTDRDMIKSKKVF